MVQIRYSMGASLQNSNFYAPHTPSVILELLITDF